MFDPQALGLETFKVRGDEVQVMCPFHDDHRPSASFNVVKGVMYCYACGSSMSARQLADELGGQVCKLTDVDLINRVKDEHEWRQFLHAPLAIDHPYLIKRKVTNDQVERYEIKRLQNGIGFPLRKGTSVHGFLVRQNTRGRKGTPRYILHGDKPPIFPFDSSFRDRRNPLLVEGVFSVLRAEHYGVTAFATLGVNVSRRNLLCFNGRRPTVLFDPDFAGYLSAAKLVVSVGASVLVPGVSVDNVTDKRALQAVLADSERTADLRRLAQYSGDPKKFWHHIDRWRQKVMFSKHDFQPSGITH